MNLTFYFQQMRRKQMQINASCNVGKRRKKPVKVKIYTIDQLNDDLDRHAMKLFALFFGSLVLLVLIGCLK